MHALIDFRLPDQVRIAGRFSAPLEVLRADRLEDVRPVLRAVEAASRTGRWCIGFVAYEAAPAFDEAFVVPRQAAGWPLAMFGVFDGPVSPATAAPGETARTGDWTWQLRPDEYRAAMAQIRRDVGDGVYYQVNLTTRLGAAFEGSPRALFDALERAQPNGYHAFLDWGEGQVLSVSPELFFIWDPRVGTLVTRPMKGTAPRGGDAADDARRMAELSGSAKERAENLMIVDLLRNDLARLALPGSVHVPALFSLEALPSVWQMTSTVAAQARPETTLEQVFTALFPCGSVTGAPKVSAMQAIARLEPEPRGVYCGAVGVVQPGGGAVFNVGIRTVALQGSRAVCGIGSGITWDSEAQAEWSEWQAKRRFLLRASARFQLLETLLLDGGAFWLRERHVARLASSARHFGFAANVPGVERALDACAAAHSEGRWRVRLLYDRDGLPAIETLAMEATPGPVAVAWADAPMPDDDEFVLHKTTARTAYERFAPAPGTFDVLLWNSRGEATEFTRGNIVLELDGRRVTPPVSCGLLAGVFRGELLARGEVSERVVSRADVARATRVWFVNSVRGMLEARLQR